jgi:NADH-quinone oxidoreductase subunit L
VNALVGSVQTTTPFGGLALLPLFPLLGAALCGLLGRRLQHRLGPRAIHVVAVGAMLLAAAAALAAVAQLVALGPADRHLVQRLWPLLRIEGLTIDLGLALDPLSAVMILVITLVGSLIHVYATGYMAGDDGQWRFFAYLNLFVFSMLLLVLGDSFLVLFFGWEGVGLCSYLLIGFWYRDREKAAAGKKAFVTNRVGDWGFLVGLTLLFWALGGDFTEASYRPDARAAGRPIAVSAPPDAAPTGLPPAEVRLGPTLNFRELGDQLALVDRLDRPVVASALAERTVWGLPLLFVVGLCLFVGVAGKSAQIPLYVWLPDAMAGPTPVSALIHAATMVTAGVYLVCRLSFLFAWTPAATTVVATAGVLTALLGAVIAVFQYDLKKVLAYSTISQLGFMLLAAGVGAYWVAVFHLVTHACFKACLFLAAGSTIHGVHGATHHAAAAPGDGGTRFGRDPRLAADPRDAQDLRNMGGLRGLMPRTRLAYLAGCLAIAGFPIAAGFYSKDEILWKAFTQHNALVPGPLLFGLGLLTAGLTSFYMFRSYYLAFWGRPATPALVAHVHESPRSMTGVLLALAAASIAIGAILGWPEAWGGHPRLERFLAPVFQTADDLLAFRRPGLATALALQATSVGVSLVGWLAARALYRDLSRTGAALERLRYRWDGLHRAGHGKLYVDEAYKEFAWGPVLDVSAALAWLDRHVVDGAVTGLGRGARALAWAGGALDRYVVDGAVNGIARLALSAGRRLTRLQTGRINVYVLVLALGVAALFVFTWLLG